MTIQTFIIEFSFINKKNIKKRLIEKINKPFFCGAAGGRTPVRTRDHRAFYMLSSHLIFVNSPGENSLTVSYPLKKFAFASRHAKTIL